MVSAWDVYWVLQLDSLGGWLTVLAVISAVCAVGFGAFGTIIRDDGTGSDHVEVGTRIQRRGWVALAGLLFFVTANSFLPSSRTAAAMILVPKLTSPEVMQPIGAEAKELYELAKGALRKLGNKPEAAK